ncbi:carbohydrate ABC transporter permease [Novisyntrophococcus fermenticellae]|uniref:carbohydrate ABC transporter permease n=1 Tax=Novisyntrophococcus fermenticellae TaxID=2068655 RepID=UPI001E29C62A|nr:carbohydrate ABC transporter permease [Novisyntrophococcus fermenticellae]
MQKDKKSPGHTLKKNWWKYLCSILIAVIYLLPIYVIVVTSFKPVTDHSSRLSLPDSIYWGNYIKVLGDGGLLNALKNTAIISVSVVIIEVIVGCLAAYPIARNRSKFNNALRSVIMGVMMIPPLSIVVGVYSTLVSINAISTYWGLIMVIAAFGVPMSIYLYVNFIRSIPVSLDEAAAIDGAGIMQVFFYIILPQLKPVTVSVIIMKGVAAWNEYAYSLYILQQKEMYNITLTVKQYFSENMNDLNAAAAGAVVAILPMIVIYLFLQKYFIKGQLDSAVKG